jgi:leader peptidase (prepilin peptidase)/N-methyltransferase
MIWFFAALIWQKISGRSPAPAALKAESPEGEPAAIGFGVHVPFGPMLAIAAAIYFLFLRDAVSIWFSRFSEIL